MNDWLTIPIITQNALIWETWKAFTRKTLIQAQQASFIFWLYQHHLLFLATLVGQAPYSLWLLLTQISNGAWVHSDWEMMERPEGEGAREGGMEWQRGILSSGYTLGQFWTSPDHPIFPCPLFSTPAPLRWASFEVPFSSWQENHLCPRGVREAFNTSPRMVSIISMLYNLTSRLVGSRFPIWKLVWLSSLTFTVRKENEAVQKWQCTSMTSSNSVAIICKWTVIEIGRDICMKLNSYGRRERKRIEVGCREQNWFKLWSRRFQNCREGLRGQRSWWVIEETPVFAL